MSYKLDERNKMVDIDEAMITEMSSNLQSLNNTDILHHQSNYAKTHKTETAQDNYNTMMEPPVPFNNMDVIAASREAA